MKLPAIPKDRIRRGDFNEVLAGMQAELERVFRRVAKDAKYGEGLAIFFTIKRFDKSGGIATSDRNSAAYKAWRAAVLKRDNYSCVRCGVHQDNAPIHADHIKPYYSNPADRLKIENGQSLCLNCHAKKHPHLGFFKRQRRQK